jgi:hypothetical protein
MAALRASADVIAVAPASAVSVDTALGTAGVVGGAHVWAGWNVAGTPAARAGVAYSPNATYALLFDAPLTLRERAYGPDGLPRGFSLYYDAVSTTVLPAASCGVGTTAGAPFGRSQRAARLYLHVVRTRVHVQHVHSSALLAAYFHCGRAHEHWNARMHHRSRTACAHAPASQPVSAAAFHDLNEWMTTLEQSESCLC